LALALGLAVGNAQAETVEVEVRTEGSDGERNVFEPALVEIEPGDTVRFLWKDMGHNAMAYHPDNHGQPNLIPEGAKAFDSGFLRRGDTFEVTLDTEGVHHYFCLPHQSMGMVGMIAVGDASRGPGMEAVEAADLPKGVEKKFRRMHEELAE
jgi:pseudoazurin